MREVIMENNELNEEIIRLAYRLILGRNPENQKAIGNHIVLKYLEEHAPVLALMPLV
jgi:hypothetical protein